MAKSPACLSCGSIEAKTGKGRVGLCNRCSKIEWEKANPVKVRAQRLYGNAQKRARELGWPKPDFSSKYIEDRILSGFCEKTGIKFDLISDFGNSHAKNPWVPSIDRIDSSKPYLKNNIQIVVYMYNVCKSEFSHDDVVLFIKALYKKEIEIGF